MSEEKESYVVLRQREFSKNVERSQYEPLALRDKHTNQVIFDTYEEAERVRQQRSTDFPVNLRVFTEKEFDRMCELADCMATRTRFLEDKFC